MSWNADQYLRFGGHRLRPVLDLIAGISLVAPGPPSRIIDLGCGPGNATMRLREQWPDAELTGLDNDPAMLQRARRDFRGARWVDDDIADWLKSPAAGEDDLVFTNAALQWLPDHDRLFADAIRAVAPGGVFACQMPRNFSAPSHRLLRETMKWTRWREQLSAYADWEPVSAPDAYYDWLLPHASSIDVWETEYLQILDGENAVLEWVKGSTLVPVRETLSAAEYAAFTDVYGAALRDAYPRRADGTTLLPFRRLFIVARRAR